MGIVKVAATFWDPSPKCFRSFLTEYFEGRMEQIEQPEIPPSEYWFRVGKASEGISYHDDLTVEVTVRIKNSSVLFSDATIKDFEVVELNGVAKVHNLSSNGNQPCHHIKSKG